MRMHFISRLALLLVAGFLVVASQVWTSGTLEWLFIVGGAVMVLVAAIDAEAMSRSQRGLDAVIALLGIWSIVQAIVFNGNELKWFSFATGVALAALAAIGLIIHENSTERIVHELTVKPEQPSAITTAVPFPH
jgi:peptidoglycan/LPS O-acetylase OafA/YrhL